MGLRVRPTSAASPPRNAPRPTAGRQRRAHPRSRAQAPGPNPSPDPDPGTTATGSRRAAPPRPAADPAATREQLLAAAAAVFAESGYREATVREICRRASANVAAVNYHFHGKEGLYTEVLRRNYQEALHRFPPDGGAGPEAPPEDRLRGFIRSFLRRIFADGVDSCHGRLLAREMVDPTPALDALVAGEIRELAEHLVGIVRALLPHGHDERGIRVCMASVVSQIVFYMHCQPVITRLFPDLTFDPSRLDALTEHITRFSLAGIREMGRTPRPRTTRR